MTIADTPRPNSTALDPDNPWPGLEAFEEAGQYYFHGREDEAVELQRRVADSALTVLFGKSGLGKTSILRAGLFPLLRVRHMLPVYVRLVLRPDAPSFGDQLAHALAAEIAANRVDAPPRDEGTALWDYLHRRPFELWSRQNFPLVPVFVLDQFEEMFTLGERVPETVEQMRIAFSDLVENRIPAGLAARIEADPSLASSLDLRSMPYKAVVSLREDYLPDLEAWRQAAPSLGRIRVRLLAMRIDQALNAVYDTAPQLMDQPVAQRIVEFVSAAQASQATAARGESPGAEGERPRGEIEPALLSLFCRGLNEQRKLQKKPRFDDELLESAKQGIISDYYRSCVEDLPESVSRFIETQLITEKGFRNSYTRDDAVPVHRSGEQLQQLIDRRLLRLEERYGTERIELTHDLLTGAVVEHRTERRALDAERERVAYAEEERRRLEAENARQRRRVWVAAIVAAICILFAAAAGYFGWRASQERGRAESALAISEARELANQSIIAGTTNPVRALELALRAADRAPASEAEFALRLAIGQSRLRTTLPAPAGIHFRHADISPKGDRMILAVPISVALSGKNHVLVGVVDGATEGWRMAEPGAYVEQHERVLQLAGVQEATISVMSAADGQWIVTLHDSAVRVWRGLAAAPKGSMRFRAPVTVAALGAEGDVLAASLKGGLQSAGGGNQVREIAPDRTESPEVIAQALSHDRRAMLQAWRDGLVRVWSVEPVRRIAELSLGYELSTASWATPWCGDTPGSSSPVATDRAQDCAVATLGMNGVLKLHTVRPAGVSDKKWTISTTGLTRSDRSSHRAAAGPGALSPDRTAWLMSRDKTVSIWDLLAQPPEARMVTGTLPAGWPFPADTQSVLAVDSNTGGYVHSLAGGREPRALTGHASNVASGSVSPDRTRVLTWGDDWTSRLWDPRTGALLSTMRGHTNSVTDASFQRDGALIATSGADSTVRVWDPSSGAQLFRFEVPEAETGRKLLDFRGTNIAYAAKGGAVHVIDCEPCLPLDELKRVARGRLDTTLR